MTCRVLIVDDEPMLAIDLANEVAKAGYEIVGPVGSVVAALKLLDERGCDVAVLDVNLGKETAAPIALALSEAGTPYVIVSGYSRAQQPAMFEHAPFVPKPVSIPALLTALAKAHAKG